MITIQQLILITYICMTGIFFMNNECAMLVPYEQKAQQFINEFSSMTFEDAGKKWLALEKFVGAQQYINEAEQKRIEQKINKDKSNLIEDKSNLIFDIVTILPYELQKNIITLFLDGNPIAADKFLERSMKYSFGLWEWAQDVYDGKRCLKFNELNRKKIVKGNKEYLKIKMSPIDIFNNSAGVMLFDKCYGKGAHTLSLNDIKILDDFFSQYVRKKVGESWINVLQDKYHEYAFYKAHTLTNVLIEIRNIFFSKLYGRDSCYEGTMFSAWIALFGTILASSSGSHFIESRYCQKIIMPDIVLRNEKRTLLNMLINQSEHAALLSDYLRVIKDPMAYSWIDIFKMKSPYFLLPGLVLLCLIMLDNYMMGRTMFRESEFKLFCGVGFCFGCILSVISFLPLTISNCLLFTLPVILFVGSMIYAFHSCCDHMLRKHTERIDWSKITELLKRDDIVIQ